MSHKLNPRFGNIHLDANALDRLDKTRSLLVDEFQSYVQRLDLSVINPKGVQDEISRPSTPRQVKDDMDGIYTVPVENNPEEREKLTRIKSLLRGHSKTAKHEADAEHLFEAAKYGGRYFITHDTRILKKAEDIRSVLCSDIQAVTLQEFVEICRNTA